MVFGLVALFMKRPAITTLLLCAHCHVACALHIGVVSKIIVDTIAGQQRIGGGGVQAAAGMRLVAWEASIQLFAPVGADFDGAMLDPLSRRYRVNTSCVARLAQAKTTPGEIISYREDDKMAFEQVGWEYWDELCAWEPPALVETSLDAIHVLVEGGGAGEVRSVLQACEASRAASRGFPCVGVEPIMHDVSMSAVDGLRAVTRVASMCSPDLATASCIGELVKAEAAAMRAAKAKGMAHKPELLPAFQPATSVDAATLSALRDLDADCTPLLDLAAACFDELCMQPGALLAIRDGSRGSYIYTRPAPKAPAWQWLADISSREYEWLAHVPALALEQMVDPTGAGNAYAGALTAALAEGIDAGEAAAAATAVGAEFCEAAAWAPENVEQASKRVRLRRKQVKEGLRVLKSTERE